MKTLGQRIRELREEQDISLRELARKLDLSAAFISDIELGRRFPSEDVLVSIASKLGTTLEDLKSHDTRPPVDDWRRLTASNPKYGIAFRRIIDNKISAEDLLELAEKKPDKEVDE